MWIDEGTLEILGQKVEYHYAIESPASPMRIHLKFEDGSILSIEYCACEEGPPPNHDNECEAAETADKTTASAVFVTIQKALETHAVTMKRDVDVELK